MTMQPMPPNQPPLLTIEQRAARLDEAIRMRTYGGWRVESRASPTMVTMVHGRPVNHVLHLLLTLVTCGVWIVGWVFVAATGGESRVSLVVDEYGNVRF